MADEQRFLVNEPSFFDTGDRRGLTAEEFLQRIDSTHPAGATDAQKIARFKKYLHGGAHQWYTLELPAVCKPHHAVWTDYSELVKRFKKNFFAISSTADASLEWLHLRQGSETPFRYVQTVIRRSAAYFQCVADSTADPVVSVTMPAGRFNRDQREAITETLAHADAKVYWERYIGLCVAQSVKNDQDRIMTNLIYRACSAGFRIEKFKAMARKALTEGTELDDFCDLVRTTQESQKLPPLEPPARVNRVDTFDESASDDDVSAVRANRNRRNKKKSKSKNAGAHAASAAPAGQSGPATEPTANASAAALPSKCAFCFRNGHVEGDCKTKMRAMKHWQQKNSGQQSKNE